MKKGKNMRKGRCKIEMKRIEDAAKSQVTFSKRRVGLTKKAHDVSVLCDIDIAFVAFSPSGHFVHHFSNKRFEDMLLRYINLPINERDYKVKNAEEKLKAIEYIELEEDRVAFVKNQVDRLQEQIRKLRTKIEVEEAEASNFKPDLNIHSLCEALWREHYLEASLNIITQKKLEMMRTTNPFSNSQTSLSHEISEEKKDNGGAGTKPDAKEMNQNIVDEPSKETNHNGLMQPSFCFGTMEANCGSCLIEKQKDPHQRLEKSNEATVVDPKSLALNSKCVNHPAKTRHYTLNGQYYMGDNLTEDDLDLIEKQLLAQRDPWLNGKIQRPRMRAIWQEQHIQESGIYVNPFMATIGDIEQPMILQQPMGLFDNFAEQNNLNWQEGEPPISNPEEMNWLPNAPITYPKNLIESGLPNPPRARVYHVASVDGISYTTPIDKWELVKYHQQEPTRVPLSSLYEPSYEKMGLHVDPFLRVLNDQKANNSQANGNNSNQPLQNQERASGQSEISSSSNNSTDLQMPEEEVEAMINSMLVNPEDADKEEQNGVEDDAGEHDGELGGIRKFI